MMPIIRKTLLLTVAVSIFSILTASIAAAQVSVTDGYIQALPPTVDNSAAYLTIRNDSSEPLILTGASVSESVASSASIHRSTNDDGMMAMEHVMSLEIAPGESVAFEPGGLHIMLMNLEAPLTPGDEVELELRFEGGNTQSITLPVQRLQP